MISIQENKQSFLALKPKKSKLFIFMILIFFSLLILSIKIKVYDNYQSKGYVSCNNRCTLTTILTTDIDYNEIYISNKKKTLELESSLVKIDEEQYISYRELIFKLDDSYQDGEIVQVNFYYNKQRFIQKIKKLIF